MSVTAHIVCVLLVLPCLGVIVRLLRHRALRPKYALFWLVIGGFTALLAAWPGLLATLARVAGVAYPPALLFLAAIALLLFVAVHHSWELSRLEERTRILAEELALRDARDINQTRTIPALGSDSQIDHEARYRTLTIQ